MQLESNFVCIVCGRYEQGSSRVVLGVKLHQFTKLFLSYIDGSSAFLMEVYLHKKNQKNRSNVAPSIGSGPFMVGG